jgi:N-acetylmuramoyl-L-alanine amidase CwlA
MTKRDEIVAIMQSWVGKNEADGSFKTIIDTYNSEKPLAAGYTVKYTDAWCDTTVSAAAIKAGISRDVFPRECGCGRHIELFKKIGAWVENDAYVPLPGDVIFYDWEDSGVGDNTGAADHVGLVESCDGKTSVVIEGNKSNAVGRRTLAVNGKYIRGFAAPKYDTAPISNGGTKMNLKQLYLTQNNCYKSGKKHTVKGIVVHSTGANNPKLSRYVGPDDGLLGANPYNNHWNTPTPGGISVCVHGFIGKLADGSIATYQTLPWDMVGWHSGSGSKGSAANANNNGYIGFEICEDGLTDAAYFNAVYKEAVELCAMLCKQYNIKPESPYLICHSEGNKLGIASNHGDVMHWFPKHSKSMDTFRADVKTAMGGATVTPTPPQTPAQPTPPAAFIPYTVKVTATELNIRKGPGTGYATNGSIKDKGVYTIVEEADGTGAKRWGKLKSGAGWISLDFTVKR